MSDTQTQPEVAGLTVQDRRAVEALYRAFSEHDPDLLDEAVTPDWQDIPLAPHQSPGREGMKPLIRQFIAAFPDIKIVVHEMIGVPGRVAVRAEIRGTHKGEWLGVPATGRGFVLPIHEFHRIDAGRITHTWHMEDWFGWMRQVGALGQSETGA
jgi:steroid delta-isomerase-like uncharacterized protein